MPKISVCLEKGKCKLMILVDHSTVEAYVDDGRYCIV